MSFVTLVLLQFLQASSSYEPPRPGEELLHEPLEDVLSPEHSDLLAGHVLKEEEGRGEREEEYEVSHHPSDWPGSPADSVLYSENEDRHSTLLVVPTSPLAPDNNSDTSHERRELLRNVDFCQARKNLKLS